MTERFEVATRLQQALSANEALFGSYRNTDGEPAIQFSGVHHLYKQVNGKPLVRPAWYFDTAVQGEGITDITTHFIDLAQWFVGNESISGDRADAVVTGARQWPTKIPLNILATITGLSEFPANVRRNVRDGALDYLCNANIRFTLRGLPVEIDSVWNLAIPEGGGDTHYCILRGTRADIVVDQGPETGFETRLRVIPVDASDAFNNVLTRALSDMQSEFPGVNHEATGTAYEIVIPTAMRHGHEARFADVLNRFLEYVDSGTWPAELGPQLVAKYSLLANARELSHR